MKGHMSVTTSQMGSVFAETWVDLEIAIQSEVSQKEKNKYFYDITYMWNLKNTTN